MATGEQSSLSRAAQHAARRRRLSTLGGDLTRTHRLAGVAALPVASIATGTIFPVRTKPVTFRTKVQITENAGEHRGLVFEFGSTAAGCALWIGDETVGFHAGPSGDTDGATALYDLGAELPVGLVLDLLASVNPGTGEVRLWGNGKEMARGKTGSGDGFAAWSDTAAGSFASNEQGTAVADVPSDSSQAPDGFEVLEPLSVYIGQIPRSFIGSL